MKGLANPDTKIYSILNKVVLMMELNVLVVLCCLPVVTAGAAISSMHAVLLKIYRNEDKRLIGDFFQAMKSNLKNGTVLWLMFLCYLASLMGMWSMAAVMIPEYEAFVLCGLALAAILGALYLNWALILQSRYVYTVMQCLKYALLAWMKYPGSTIVYLVSMAVPVLLCAKVALLPLVLMVGITLPNLISTTLYSRVFDRMEGIPDRLPEL